MRISAVVAAAFMILAGGPALADDGAAGGLEAARQALLSIPLGDGLQTDVSPRAQADIAAFKARLFDFIDERVAALPGDADAQAAEAALADGAHKAGDDDRRYGADVSFEASRPAAPKGLLTVTARFAIECGQDALFLVFERHGGAWRPALRWTSAPYTKVSGGLWAFDARISPDAAGGWYVLVKSIAPWCSSTWSTIDYAALKPRPGGVEPRILHKGADSMWWGGEDYGTLKAGPRGFEVRFHSASIDTGVHNRPWIRRFALVGDRVRRIAPWAASPRDFVDEWIVSPWREAAGWSSAQVRGQRALHDRLSPGRTGVLSFAAERRCAGGREVQVELDAAAVKGPRLDRYFFRVRGAGDFRMVRAGRRPDPDCRGPDILPKAD